MVDVDQRTAGGLTPAHAAGLRRLSARASSSASISAPLDGLCFSFSPLAESLVAHLRSVGVPLLPGLSAAEMSHAEAALGLPIPPDLRAVLSLAVPSGPGFPDWRSIPRLCSSIRIPFAAASLQISRGSLRPRHRPPSSSADPRDAIRRAPPLLPIFDRCYVPALPCLAGNPVFFVDERRVSIHSSDISDFFTRQRSSSSPLDLLPPPPRPPPLRRSLDSVAGRNPRWIEFWSDAASSYRRRRSSASSAPPSSPLPPDRESFVEIRPPRLPDWVAEYLDGIGAALRGGGWGESDVSEMVHLSRSGSRCSCIAGRDDDGDDDGEAVVRDSRAALESLLLKADRHSESLRRAGWSSDEVCDALGFDDHQLLPQRRRRSEAVKLPPELAAKIGRLAEAVFGK